MTTAIQSLDDALDQVKRVRRILKSKNQVQVRSSDEVQLIASSAQAWFNNFLPIISASFAADETSEINSGFRSLLVFTDKGTARSKYDMLLKDIAKALAKLRIDIVSGAAIAPMHINDDPPDFSPLAGDERMQRILKNRWIECYKCVLADAPLAATVMMGGMLESLLVARTNKEPDKIKLFRSRLVPINKKTQKPAPFQEWTLKNYIDVAHDLKWITQSAKDIGEVLRDYRNYVHPQKEYVHNVELGDGDASLFWDLTKSMARQLIAKAP